MGWREIAATVVAETLEKTAGQSPAEVQRALRAAYPFFERKHYPYKVWLDEIRKQTGQPRGTIRRRFEVDWNCAECGKVGTKKVNAFISTPELMAAIRTAHADASPECPSQQVRWSYLNFYRRTKADVKAGAAC